MPSRTPSVGAGAGEAVVDAALAVHAGAVPVGEGETERGAGDRDQRLEKVGVAPAGDGGAVDDEAEHRGRDERRNERADDAAPETVRDEHREVPYRDAHHDPDDEAHRRPCFFLARWRFDFDLDRWVDAPSPAVDLLREAERAAGAPSPAGAGPGRAGPAGTRPGRAGSAGRASA